MSLIFKSPSYITTLRCRYKDVTFVDKDVIFIDKEVTFIHRGVTFTNIHRELLPISYIKIYMIYSDGTSICVIFCKKFK